MIVSLWRIILTHFFFFCMYVGMRNFLSLFLRFEHFILVLLLAAQQVHFMNSILVYTLALNFFYYFLRKVAKIL